MYRDRGTLLHWNRLGQNGLSKVFREEVFCHLRGFLTARSTFGEVEPQLYDIPVVNKGVRRGAIFRAKPRAFNVMAFLMVPRVTSIEPGWDFPVYSHLLEEGIGHINSFRERGECAEAVLNKSTPHMKVHWPSLCCEAPPGPDLQIFFLEVFRGGMERSGSSGGGSGGSGKEVGRGGEVSERGQEGRPRSPKQVSLPLNPQP